MDAYQILSNDHRAVDRIFEEIEQTDSRKTEQCDRLFQKLKKELELHTLVEEKIFYLEMKKHAAIEALVGEALEEHDEVKQMLQEVAELSLDDDQWSEKVAELKQAVQHHVREEESRMFPAARTAIDDSRARELGREIEAMKQKAGA